MYKYKVEFEQWAFSGMDLLPSEKIIQFEVSADDFEHACDQAQLFKQALMKNVRVWQARILAITQIKR